VADGFGCGGGALLRCIVLDWRGLWAGRQWGVSETAGDGNGAIADGELAGVRDHFRRGGRMFCHVAWLC
jgi:hypothetical protein